MNARADEIIPLEIRNINIEQALTVRHKVLWPDKPVEFCRVDGDAEATHLGGFYGDLLVCVASMFINETDSGLCARLRKFATLPTYQRKGVGTRVLKYAMDAMRERGVSQFWCDARIPAVPFYERFAMSQEGSVFIKSGLEYVKMSVMFSGGLDD